MTHRAALRDAEEELHAAIAKLRSVAAAYVRAEADDSGVNAGKALINIASTNASKWSGGYTNANNICEALVHDAAISHLRYK